MPSKVVPIEDVECQLFHQFLERYLIPHTHIPNESRISSKRAAAIRGKKLKDMGVSAGYWDYDVYIPVLDLDDTVGAYELIKIEMKRAQKSLSTVSAAQKKWKKVYDLAGIPNYICYGHEQAEQVVRELFENINREELTEEDVIF